MQTFKCSVKGWEFHPTPRNHSEIWKCSCWKNNLIHGLHNKCMI